MLPEERLKELGISLPEAPRPLGSYVPCVQAGNLLFLSGILPLRDGKLMLTGRVGEAVSLGEAQGEAKQTVINALSVVRSHTGSIDRIKKCVKLTGFIASAPDFIEQPKVLNAASDFLFEIFGDEGRHARVAVGVSALPLNSPLEVEFIFELS
ncbi:MAG: RidA family protein [Nitrospirae bacterium]|nr:MAG: RidA family protein [Nitrospirota bacterium]